MTDPSRETQAPAIFKQWTFNDRVEVVHVAVVQGQHKVTSFAAEKCSEPTGRTIKTGQGLLESQLQALWRFFFHLPQTFSGRWQGRGEGSGKDTPPIQSLAATHLQLQLKDSSKIQLSRRAVIGQAQPEGHRRTETVGGLGGGDNGGGYLVGVGFRRHLMI